MEGNRKREEYWQPRWRLWDTLHELEKESGKQHYVSFYIIIIIAWTQKKVRERKWLRWNLNTPTNHFVCLKQKGLTTLTLIPEWPLLSWHKIMQGSWKPSIQCTVEEIIWSVREFIFVAFYFALFFCESINVGERVCLYFLHLHSLHTHTHTWLQNLLCIFRLLSGTIITNVY